MRRKKRKRNTSVVPPDPFYLWPAQAVDTLDPKSKLFSRLHHALAEYLQAAECEQAEKAIPELVELFDLSFQAAIQGEEPYPFVFAFKKLFCRLETEPAKQAQRSQVLSAVYTQLAKRYERYTKDAAKHKSRARTASQAATWRSRKSKRCLSTPELLDYQDLHGLSDRDLMERFSRIPPLSTTIDPMEYWRRVRQKAKAKSLKETKRRLARDGLIRVPKRYLQSL